MKQVFRLYDKNKTKLKASIFDLINGDFETKQTKGLAYIFKEYPDLILNLIKNSEVKKYTSLKSFRNVSLIEVSAEKITSHNNRIDILIKLDMNNKPYMALVIEAKSIKAGINPNNVVSQALGYLSNEELPDLVNYTKIPIILTKYKTILGSDGVVSISWNDIIGTIESSKERISGNLLDQYYDFITGVDGDMKYYEREVLSIPAGKTIELVEKHLVYECPNTKYYQYKKPIFLAFRKSGGGEMSQLYKIEEIIVLNPTVESEIEVIKDSDLDSQIKNRLLKFIKNNGYDDELDHEKRFYILSDDEIIDLPNNPKPKINNSKFTYYRLSDMLTKTVVSPASKFV